jgi:hypothetical protein
VKLGNYHGTRFRFYSRYTFQLRPIHAQIGARPCPHATSRTFRNSL